MIIFDLDNVLADCSHRMHFIDPRKRSSNGLFMNENKNDSGIFFKRSPETLECTNEIWQPDYQSFYEACDKDKPIYTSWFIFSALTQTTDVLIWTSRCESTKQKTINWLMNKCPLKPTYWDKYSWEGHMKFRPIGDDSPIEKIKERWLDDRILGQYCNLCYGSSNYITCQCKSKAVDMVFDSHPESIAMWRRRGIFVFDCNQEK